MARKNVLEAVHDALDEELGRDASVILMGEDVGTKGGVFLATHGLAATHGEDRVIDAPLAESVIVGAAIGAAMNGLKPVAEIQFADFIYPAMDQIISEASKIRYRSKGGYSCPIVVRTPYGGGIRGALYHSQSVEAFFCHVPGLKVVAPSTPYDTKGLLKAAIRDPDPVVFLEHKRTYRAIQGEVPDEDYLIPIGQADVKREGANLTVLTYGMMVHLCLEAAEQMQLDGVSVEVVDLRTLAPLDTATILESVRKTGKVMIVHEDHKTGGLAGELTSIIMENAFMDLDAPVLRVTGPDVPAIPFSAPLEEFFLPNTEKICAAMERLARF